MRGRDEGGRGRAGQEIERKIARISFQLEQKLLDS